MATATRDIAQEVHEVDIKPRSRSGELIEATPTDLWECSLGSNLFKNYAAFENIMLINKAQWLARAGHKCDASHLPAPGGTYAGQPQTSVDCCRAAPKGTPNNRKPAN